MTDEFNANYPKIKQVRSLRESDLFLEIYHYYNLISSSFAEIKWNSVR